MQRDHIDLSWNSAAVMGLPIDQIFPECDAKTESYGNKRGPLNDSITDSLKNLLNSEASQIWEPKRRILGLPGGKSD